MYFPHFSKLMFHFLSANINNISTFYSHKFPCLGTLPSLHSMNIKCYRLKCWKSPAYCPCQQQDSFLFYSL